ncbi:MAG: hypothetical protein JWM80_4834 [Cyanobacteria bacterium RYN_339]|nr:hypothetical protein [Cyanobacteria bacterium RYN_339]
MRNQPIAAVAIVVALAAPAYANCPEEYVETREVAPFFAKAVAAMKLGPNGKFFDRLDGELLYVTPAFEALPGPRQANLAREASQALWTAIPTADVERIIGTGHVAHSVKVADHLGRWLYVNTPCWGDFTTLTEHQRFVAMFSFGSDDERGFRTQTHPLPKRIDLRAMRRNFGRKVGLGAGYYLGWVPEGGFFELDVPRASDAKRVKAFLPSAPRGYRYDVRLNDGTLLVTERR